MCIARNRFASSMNGHLSFSESFFHSAPRRFEISELCILGLSTAILRLCMRDQTINAFMGRFTCESLDVLGLLSKPFGEVNAAGDNGWNWYCELDTLILCRKTRTNANRYISYERQISKTSAE